MESNNLIFGPSTCQEHPDKKWWDKTCKEFIQKHKLGQNAGMKCMGGECMITGCDTTSDKDCFKCGLDGCNKCTSNCGGGVGGGGGGGIVGGGWTDEEKKNAYDEMSKALPTDMPNREKMIACVVDKISNSKYSYSELNADPQLPDLTEFGKNAVLSCKAMFCVKDTECKDNKLCKDGSCNYECTKNGDCGKDSKCVDNKCKKNPILSTGAIIGISIGAVVLIAIFSYIIYYRSLHSVDVSDNTDNSSML